ncbi:baseplate J/gp47 family protein [Chitinophaga sp. sic0106]|uniref:baseplate assembly protein n=1 Tax=Chitinophaga sp. sic0106 TaxID=2854785 RepID=UPI001C4856FC|nr:baseplate J/gp47 family protein [Chitinophaga sp. sic0106]MBV7529044.1 baseplate J/gp47 family protein [Chitinophaga sp. sic0106]
MADNFPEIFEEGVQPKLQRIQKRLEDNLGRALAPADVEMLIANAVAYEAQLICIAGNQAVKQSLVPTSTGAMLEYLGELVGVKRLPASGAECTIRFNLINGHNGVQIPDAVRVQSIDGNAIFITTGAVDAPIGTTTVDVVAVCQTPGVIGNNYDPGKISIILDPQAFVTTAANIDATSGGADAEDDDQLRERISLAPSSFSVAGPKGAYKFWAKSAHPTIVDVAVITTAPGEITLYPLCDGGTLPSTEILGAVLSVCSDEKVRPQNDTVLSAAPTVTSYNINAEVTTYTGAINSEVLDQINSNLNTYKQERNNRLGMDVIKAQISALCMIKDKVYTVNIVSPSADIIADDKTYTKCTGISVTITGSNNG